jgi:hypothetical protein
MLHTTKKKMEQDLLRHCCSTSPSWTPSCYPLASALTHRPQTGVRSYAHTSARKEQSNSRTDDEGAAEAAAGCDREKETVNGYSVCLRR